MTFAFKDGAYNYTKQNLMSNLFFKDPQPYIVEQLDSMRASDSM